MSESQRKFRLLSHREHKHRTARSVSPYKDDMDVARTLWSGLDIEHLKCCHCGKEIRYDQVLARTFKLKGAPNDKDTCWAETITVPTLEEELLVYHRHLDCLQSSTPYIAVSHVWHPEVAELQYERHANPSRLERAADELLESPTRICRALVAKGEDVEVWHDYISVPQWQREIKRVIIQDIPRIYTGAKFVLMHLSDVDVSNLVSMRQGKTVDEIARGVSNFCNAAYFSRVWTAMEYTQNKGVRVILKDYVWVDPHPKYPFFVSELNRTWEAQLAKHAHPTTVEKMVSMGYNLVPWQLGPLQNLRNLNDAGKPTIFATAYELLARRNVTLQRDFFHALIGTLKLNDELSEAELSEDNKEALMQVARHCIRRGDLSPLFMIPASAQHVPDKHVMQQYGYADTVTWGMGDQISPATYGDASASEDGTNRITLIAEELGVVRTARRERTSFMDDWDVFGVNLKIALESAADMHAPDFIDFIVNTLGARLYGVTPKRIHERLTQKGWTGELAVRLRKTYNAYPLRDKDCERWIADAMGLSNLSIRPAVSPMASLSSYAGSIHLGNAMSYVTVKCSRCQNTFVIRVALLKLASEVLGARAYRVPGLKYFSVAMPGGAGFLLNKHNKIVGRFVWGTPTCACDMLGPVNVMLDELPMPRANDYRYGTHPAKPGQWIPLKMEARINFD